ncbi:histidine kinase [Fischerella thermalis CCMEE 5201]|nr:histidine kinase [Fischerella thermalis CCMEE 5201]
MGRQRKGDKGDKEDKEDKGEFLFPVAYCLLPIACSPMTNDK